MMTCRCDSLADLGRYRRYRQDVANRQPSWASSETTRRSMRSNQSRDTGPELAVRSAVHRLGLRYRVNSRPEPSLRRTADLVFRTAKVAVFVDGCFWHSCPVHGTKPRMNDRFWCEKLERTVQRDLETNKFLRAMGWTVLRFWEHEEPAMVAERIRNVVVHRGSTIERAEIDVDQCLPDGGKIGRFHCPSISTAPGSPSSASATETLIHSPLRGTGNPKDSAALG